MGYEPDPIDERILYYLAIDARNITAPTVADEVDVTSSTIRNRVKQLEKTDIIEGYHAQINYQNLNFRHVHLFICTAPPTERSEYVKEVSNIQTVVHVRELLTGKQNIHVVVVGRTSDEIVEAERELASIGLEVETENYVQNETIHPYIPFGQAESIETGKESPVQTYSAKK